MHTHTHTNMHYEHDVLTALKRVICPPARIDNVIKCKQCQRHQKRQRLAALQKALHSARRWARAGCLPALFNLNPGRRVTYVTWSSFGGAKDLQRHYRARKRTRARAPTDPSILPIFANGADFRSATACVYACVCVWQCARVSVCWFY